jgi:nucleotide-binding universal stress UspA family protein
MSLDPDQTLAGAVSDTAGSHDTCGQDDQMPSTESLGDPVMKCILVATDGSEGAKRAVGVAAVLAHGIGTRLLILSVGSESMDGGLAPLARSEGDVGTAIDAILASSLKTAKEIARQAGVTDVKTSAAWGEASEVIIETARRIGADIIVLGRRGRGRLAGLLLGSVSQKVVMLAHCSVLVVP